MIRRGLPTLRLQWTPEDYFSNILVVSNDTGCVVFYSRKEFIYAL